MPGELKNMFLRAFNEGWNKGNPEAMFQLCATEFVHHRPPFPDIIGVEAEKEDIAITFRIFSEIQFSIHELMVNDKTVVMRWSLHAKHTGRSKELPILPTGKQVAMDGCSILHLVDEKIVEEWEFADYLGYLTQLGVIPPLE